LKTFLSLLIALGGGVLFPAFGADAVRVPPDKSIVMIGDSITHQGNWEQALDRHDVVNWGIPGYTTGQLAWTFKDVVREHPQVKVVFLEGGINDLTLGIPPDRIFTNFVQAVAWWREHNVMPVVQSVILQTAEAETNTAIIALNTRLRAFCGANHVEFLDLNAVLASDGHLKPELSTDGTHLQPDAYPLWAGLVKACLVRLGR
jgi:alpha-glucosidase